MNPGMFDRRRAERFAQLVDELTGRRRRHRRSDFDRELTPLAALTTRIGEERLAPPPEPEFRVGLRAMLLATIDREGIGATAIDAAERSVTLRDTPVRRPLATPRPTTAAAPTGKPTAVTAARRGGRRPA